MEPLARREEEAGRTPRRIYAELDRFVIGQEEAKRALAIAAYNHLKRIDARKRRQATLLRKSNVLLIGPTGSGKTHLARNLARILSVPFTTVDATEYTEAGYYGKDVEMMIAELLLRSDYVVEQAERGIIFIDEVDKLARRTQGAKTGAGARDIGGEGVQQALLKVLEGRDVYVPMSMTQHWNKQDVVQVDTRDILFICAGAFSDLLGYGSDELARPIGFGAGSRRRGHRSVTTHQLTEYGMLPEFLGRLPVTVELRALEEDDLVRILVEPPDAITREYRELLLLDGIDLQFEDGALREVVRHALERNLGARGLRTILEQVMRDVMFEAPEAEKRAFVIDRAFVRARIRASTH